MLREDARKVVENHVDDQNFHNLLASNNWRFRTTSRGEVEYLHPERRDTYTSTPEGKFYHSNDKGMGSREMSSEEAYKHAKETYKI